MSSKPPRNAGKRFEEMSKEQLIAEAKNQKTTVRKRDLIIDYLEKHHDHRFQNYAVKKTQPQKVIESIVIQHQAPKKERKRIVQQPTLKQVVQRLRDYQKKGKNPVQVVQAFNAKDKETMDLFTEVHQMLKSPAYRKRLEQMLGKKMAKDYAKNNNLYQDDAFCALIMDDFFDTVKGGWSAVKNFGSKAVEAAKRYYNDNRETVHKVVKGLATSVFPEAASIFETAQKVYDTLSPYYGGTLLSEDPYCMDPRYLEFVFSGIGATPAPRSQSHYLYQMCATTETPVTTLADGTALIVVSPYHCHTTTIAVNSSQLPYLTVANTSSTNPYNGMATNITNVPGPFNGQLNNFINFGVDSCRVSFINTEADLQVKGKVTTSVYYESPNATWNRNSFTSLYNHAAIAISDSELINNLGFYRRYSSKQCQRMRPLATFIVNSDFDNIIGASASKQGGNLYDSNLPFIIIKMTGCNPNTLIGTITTQVSISVQPISSMRNILKVTPRGSYQGTYRAFKQCRKLGLPLEFFGPDQAVFLYRQHFGEVRFPNPVSFGEGQYRPLPGHQLIPVQNPISGLCVHQSLEAIGVQNDLGMWASFPEALNYTSSVARRVQSNLIYYQYPKTGNKYVLFDDEERHASPVTIYDSTKLREFVQDGNLIVLHDKTFRDISQDFIPKCEPQVMTPQKAAQTLDNLSARPQIAHSSTGEAIKEWVSNRIDVQEMQDEILIASKHPMTRELIMQLLSKGNVESNPGPMTTLQILDALRNLNGPLLLHLEQLLPMWQYYQPLITNNLEQFAESVRYISHPLSRPISKQFSNKMNRNKLCLKTVLDVYSHLCRKLSLKSLWADWPETSAQKRRQHMTRAFRQRGIRDIQQEALCQLTPYDPRVWKLLFFAGFKTAQREIYQQQQPFESQPNNHYYIDPNTTQETAFLQEQPMTREQIQTELVKGGIQPNPGPLTVRQVLEKMQRSMKSVKFSLAQNISLWQEYIEQENNQEDFVYRAKFVDHPFVPRFLRSMHPENKEVLCYMTIRKIYDQCCADLNTSSLWSDWPDNTLSSRIQHVKRRLADNNFRDLFALDSIRDFYTTSPVVWKLLAYIDVHLSEYSKTVKQFPYDCPPNISYHKQSRSKIFLRFPRQTRKLKKNAAAKDVIKVYIFQPILECLRKINPRSEQQMRRYLHETQNFNKYDQLRGMFRQKRADQPATMEMPFDLYQLLKTIRKSDELKDLGFQMSTKKQLVRPWKVFCSSIIQMRLDWRVLPKAPEPQIIKMEYIQPEEKPQQPQLPNLQEYDFWILKEQPQDNVDPRVLIQTELLKGGIQQNPGPTEDSQNQEEHQVNISDMKIQVKVKYQPLEIEEDILYVNQQMQQLLDSIRWQDLQERHMNNTFSQLHSFDLKFNRQRKFISVILKPFIKSFIEINPAFANILDPMLHLPKERQTLSAYEEFMGFNAAQPNEQQLLRRLIFFTFLATDQCARYMTNILKNKDGQPYIGWIMLRAFDGTEKKKRVRRRDCRINDLQAIGFKQYMQRFIVNNELPIIRNSLTKQEIKLQLQRGCIESNPGPQGLVVLSQESQDAEAA